MDYADYLVVFSRFSVETMRHLALVTGMSVVILVVMKRNELMHLLAGYCSGEEE